MYEVKFGSELIKNLFLELHNETIDYVILRNYQGLPESNSSKDVDILIDENNIQVVNTILLELAKKLNYYFVWENKLDYLIGYAFTKIVNNIVYSIKIDLFHNLKWRGLEYIDHNLVFQKKEQYSSLYIPNKSHESFIMVLYYILYAKNIKNKYFENIYLYKNDIENFELISAETLGNVLAKKMVDLLESKNILKLITCRKEIIKTIISRNIKTFPLMIKNIINHLYYEIFKRNFFGTVVLFDKNCNEKDFINSLFVDLGIGNDIKSLNKLNLFNLLKILRKNPVIVLYKNDLTNFQKKIFSKRIIVVNNKIEDIFLNIEQMNKGYN